MINEFQKIDEDFKNLRDKNKLNINSLENLLSNDIKDYKERLHAHVGELLTSEINEKELISKKKRMGRKRIQDKK